jgi:8-oxo-dGTP diphosphatase
VTQATSRQAARNGTFVANVLIHTDEELLLLKRATDTPWPGLWDMPGGLVDPDEDPEQAAERECREETGISVRLGAALLDAVTPDLVHDRGMFRTVVYEARTPQRTTPVLSSEHVAALWVPFADVHALADSCTWYVPAVTQIWRLRQVTCAYERR